MSTADIFLKDFKENEDLNQYWYSNFTIQKMVDESTNLYNKYGGSSNNFRIGCLSTPSIYFSFNDEIRKNSYVFDVGFPNISYEYFYIIILLLLLF